MLKSGRKHRMKNVSAILILCLLCFLINTACGAGDGKETGGDDITTPTEKDQPSLEETGTDTVTESDEGRTEEEQSARRGSSLEDPSEKEEEDPENPERKQEVDVKTIRDLEKEEALAAVMGDTGIDFSEYISDAAGVDYNGLYYVRLHISGGKEAAAEKNLRELCGEGYDPHTRMIPKARNRICDELNAVGPAWAYQYMHSGKGGAKTATTSFFTAVENGETSIFVMGTK